MPFFADHAPEIEATTRETSPGIEPIAYRRVESYRDALALSFAAWDVYHDGYKDLIYYPDEVLERIRSRRLRSWIAADSSGRVLGHYAMMRSSPRSPLAEMGAAFVRPEARMHGVFKRLSECLHADALECGARALYSLSVTDHMATQRLSAQAGRVSIGLRLASTPSVFASGATQDERGTSVLNYRQLAFGRPRVVYPPERHRTMILSSFSWLGIPVMLGRQEDAARADRSHTIEHEWDHAWNRASIEAIGGKTALLQLQELTEHLSRQGVVSIVLSIDLEDPRAALTADEAEKLGYFYSGIFPEGCHDGHHALQLQRLNGVTSDPARIRLHQPTAHEIMAYIAQVRPQAFRQSPKGNAKTAQGASERSKRCTNSAKGQKVALEARPGR